MKNGNVLADIPAQSMEELFETIFEKSGTRIERIISYGQGTPEGEWYDQEHDEWVLLLSGFAELQIEGEIEPRRLRSGDYLLLPARCRHRVIRTDADEKTIWLAIHICSGN
ncbi:MAG TPA: cupin domain-containing protein [Geobacteraceae bacterium]|nr:cupin domain-containing protein [Geobacteraceae bacterium]